MKDVILSTGLKCDNPKCDWNETIKVEDHKKWIGKPCPKCGEVVLTQQDYDTSMSFYRILTNPIVKFLLQPFVCKKPKGRISIHENEITITKIEQ
jgi:ssDNA-binding Zn-finger/Zn-ribbon topoisomerase 1